MEVGMNAYVYAAGLVVTLGLADLSTDAQAESRDQWCGKYARIAVAQYKEARGFNRCRRQDARWHDDELTHFSWCTRVAEDAARAEDRARRAHLQTCKAVRLD
jgi:hypothetical protein